MKEIVKFKDPKSGINCTKEFAYSSLDAKNWKKMSGLFAKERFKVFSHELVKDKNHPSRSERPFQYSGSFKFKKALDFLVDKATFFIDATATDLLRQGSISSAWIKITSTEVGSGKGMPKIVVSFKHSANSSLTGYVDIIEFYLEQI